jgi:RHS repeat-associated protein
MGRLLRFLLLVCVLINCLVLQVSAQSYLYGTGTQTWGINLPIENGFINVANGEVHLEISLANHAQRGSLALNEALVYDSRIWQIIANGSSYGFQPTNVPNSMAGWRFIAGNEAGSIQVIPVVQDVDCYGGNPSGNQPAYYDYWFAWTDPSGAVHQFPIQTQQPISGFCSGSSVNYNLPNTPTGTGYAVDGSGYYMSVTNYMTAVIFDTNGNQVYPSVIDRNGNNFSADANGNLMDTLGRVPVTKSTSGNQIYYDVLTVGGATKRYTVTTETINVHTAFGQSGVNDYSNSLTAIQSIALPDGSSYTFTYDSGTSSGNYGELESITLPTGGTVSFGYQNYLDSYQNQNRWLSSYSGGHGSYTFTPQVVSQCTGSTKVGCQEKMTVMDGNDNNVVYLLTLNNGAWNSQVDFYNGSSSHVMSTATNYNFATSCQFYNCNGAQWVTASSVTTTLSDTGQMAQTQYTYAYPWTAKPSTVKMWDYYTGSPSGTPSKETDYTYGNFINGAAFVTQVNQLANGSLAGQTVFNYDQGTLTTTSGLPNHGSAPGTSRGNLTSVVSGTGATVTTSSTYDDAGTQLTAVDGKGNSTSYTAMCSDAYRQVVTYPMVVNGANLQSKTMYDCSSGLVTSTQDMNGVVNNQSTTYSYFTTGLNIGRLQTLTYPDTGSTTYLYPSSTEVDQSVAQSSSVSVTSKTILDSYGRNYQSVLNAPEGAISAETTYDLTGRLNSVTNPHLQGTSSSSDGTTLTYYDVLGRVTTVQMPDGSSVTTSYSGSTQTVSDQQSHSRKLTYDAFHRLTSVLEPNGSGVLTYETDYQYDGLDNLIQVDQWGGPNGTTGERQRKFTYDSLSRLVQELSPEAGWICYGTTGGAPASGSNCTSGYDGNGNLLAKTDARGKTLSWGYDSLNRVTSESSSDGSVSYSYSYDNTTSGSVGGLGRLFGAFNASGTSIGSGFYYDSMGRVIGQSYQLPNPGSWQQAFNIQYDLAGNIVSFSYPDNRVVTQTWDSAGRLSTVNYASYNGTAVNYPYVQSATYFPTGSLNTVKLGNGVAETYGLNNRLQPTEMQVQTTANSVNQSVFDKVFCYGPTTSKCSSSGVLNNGNIQAIIDAQNSTRNQTFSYDTLNRVTSFATSNPSVSQTYSYDPFGNMNQVSPGTLQSNLMFGTNNQVSSTGFGYDQAGNMTQQSFGAGLYGYYAYDAASRLTNLDSGTATYSYDALGNRVRKVVGGNWSQYVYFNGQLMAEQNNDGSWFDYIYANGQRIARAENEDYFLVTTGTTPGGEGAAWTIPGPSYTIKQGDQLEWMQLQFGGYGGPDLIFTDNSQTHEVLRDNSGQLADVWTTLNAWQARSANLSAYAGKTVASYALVDDPSSPAGSYGIYYEQISIVSTDGTVTPINYRRLGDSIPNVWNQGQTNLSASEQGLSPSSPQNNVTYYIGDQIGSAGMLAASGGYPVSVDTFYPYGPETSTPAGDNEMKFAGLFRDSEIGLDYATFRQYSSPMGRWLSADPYGGSYDWTNPQSLNRYAYVMNSPMTSTDPSGLDGGVISVGSTAGGCIGVVLSEGANPFADIGCGLSILKDVFSSGSSFHGSLKPRPNAGTWSEQDPNTGITSLGVPMGGGLSPLSGISGLNQALGLPTMSDLSCMPICDATDPDEQRIHDLAVGITADSQHSFGCIGQAFGMGAPTETLRYMGQPVEGTKPFVGDGSIGTSPISDFLSDLIPWKLPKGIRFPAPTGGPFTGKNFALKGSRNIGRQLGRWAPIVGWVGDLYATARLWGCL